jgi:hypothetical protein
LLTDSVGMSEMPLNKFEKPDLVSFIGEDFYRHF